MIAEPWLTMLVVLAVIWSLIWMGLGMWKASKKDHKWWFIVFLFIHTLGILEILYIYWFSECKCCGCKADLKPKKKAKKK